MTAPQPTVPPAYSPPLKPGWRTSEFWVTILTSLGLVIASSTTSLAPRYAALGSAIAAGLYAVARGLAKAYPPKDGPR